MVLCSPAPQVQFVSAFLDLQEDRSKDKSPTRCFEHFKELVATGISIHLFLSAVFLPGYMTIIGPRHNVHIEMCELADTETAKFLSTVSYTVPTTNTPHHDTANFMTLMNAKTEFVMRAMNAHPNASHFAWIDFSIGHVFRRPEQTLAYLKFLGATRLQPTCLYIPGCWAQGTALQYLYTSVNWRFCGGFFVGDRASLAAFHATHRHFLETRVPNHKILPWEVNLWADMEANSDWRPTWFSANHNDSIVHIPTEAFYTVASLTAIPPRLETECRLTLDSLLSQVDHIYLSLPLAYDRFGPLMVLPDYLSEEPYASRVTVVRPPRDFGPATKYIGALGHIPAGSLVFVCDDDQEYAPNLLFRMRAATRELAAYQNHYMRIREKTSGGMIHGYVGNLFPECLLRGAAAFPLPAGAKFVDDQWMSIYCHLHQIPVLASGIEPYAEIFSVLQGGHEKLGTDALSSLNNRDQKVAEVAAAFGLQFMKDATGMTILVSNAKEDIEYEELVPHSYWGC